MSKKQQIIELYKKGLTRSQITNDLKTYYSYVCQAITDYKKNKRLEEFELLVKNK